jgi:hypothetical protein
LNEFIQNHIDQVQRMLPGGLSIQGIYITGDDEILKKENLVPLLNEIENSILLHRTKNGLQCYRVVSNGLSTIEIQKQSELPSITRFKTVVPIHIKAPLEKDTQLTIQKAIDKFIDCIINDSELLVNGKKLESSALSGNVNVDVYGTNLSYVDPNLENYVIIEGSIESLCYLHSNCSTEEIINEIKRDLKYALDDAFDVLCSEGKLEGALKWQLPSRRFVQVDKFCFCDYVMPDEPEEDIISRFKYLLGVELDPPQKKDSTKQSTQTVSPPPKENKTESTNNSTNFAQIIPAILFVSIFAIVLVYIISNKLSH